MTAEESDRIVEWLADRGTVDYRELVTSLEAFGLIPNADAWDRKILLAAMLSELTDLAILDLNTRAGGRSLPAQLVPIRQDGDGLKVIVCGARDTATNSSLMAIQGDIDRERVGQFGIKLIGSRDAVFAWANRSGMHVNPWLGMQSLYRACDELGAPTARASLLGRATPTVDLRAHSVVRRSLRDWNAREELARVPNPARGDLIEVLQDRFTPRWDRYVGTEQGWLPVPFRWAPHVASVARGLSLARAFGTTIEVNWWTKLPDGISRFIVLATGKHWSREADKLVMRDIPAGVLSAVRRALSLG